MLVIARVTRQAHKVAGQRGDEDEQRVQSVGPVLDRSREGGHARVVMHAEDHPQDHLERRTTGALDRADRSFADRERPTTDIGHRAGPAAHALAVEGRHHDLALAVVRLVGEPQQRAGAKQRIDPLGHAGLEQAGITIAVDLSDELGLTGGDGVGQARNPECVAVAPVPLAKRGDGILGQPQGAAHTSARTRWQLDGLVHASSIVSQATPVRDGLRV